MANRRSPPVDPIADLAVLGAPDREADFDAAAYDAFVDGCSVVRVGGITAPALLGY
jgi:hypothetical protein